MKRWTMLRRSPLINKSLKNQWQLIKLTRISTIVLPIKLKMIVSKSQQLNRSSLILSIELITITINNVRKSTRVVKLKSSIMKHIRNGWLKKSCEMIQK
jgi:hypothetical protein